MRKVLFLFAFVFLVACSTVPITGRKQLKIISGAEMNAMAFEQYGAFLMENKLSSDKQKTALIKKVGNNIRIAVDEYLASVDQSNLTAGFEWEFNLIEDPNLNAWAMPGGKVVFYTGILPICQDEAGIAVVMGHEIAHAIAGHGNERMSQGLITQVGISVLDEALKEKPEETRNLMLAAVGAGAQLGLVLPFSRTHEREADKMGLIFMTIAGYNPEAAPELWERMAALNQGQQPPEFLSTHPSNQSRIADLRAAIPEALTYRK